PAAEQAAEQIAEVAELAEVEADAAAARIEAHAAVRRPVVVVGLALLGIREDVVSRLELLEALLRLRVARVLVGVVLARELPVRLLDLGLRRPLGNAEDLVEVPSRARRHQVVPPPGRPRQRRVRGGARRRRAGSPSARPPSPSPPRPRPAARARGPGPVASAAPGGRARGSPRASRSRPGRPSPAFPGPPGARGGRRPGVSPPRGAGPGGARARGRRHPAGALGRAVLTRARPG